MFDVAASLQPALDESSASLAGAAARTSRAQTALGDSRVDGAMAGAARADVFAEALLSAVHARLAELKVVAHG